MPRAMNHPDYRYTPWSDERRLRASLAARERYGRRVSKRQYVREDPPLDEWVLAYWPHMARLKGKDRGGWHPSRLRIKPGTASPSWQMQANHFRCYPAGKPFCWIPMEKLP